MTINQYKKNKNSNYLLIAKKLQLNGQEFRTFREGITFRRNYNEFLIFFCKVNFESTKFEFKFLDSDW